MFMTFDQQVANAARYLDQQYPGWEKEIDPGTLDLVSCTKCILGQVFKTGWGKDDPVWTGIMVTIFGKDFLGNTPQESSYDRYNRHLRQLGFTIGVFSSNLTREAWLGQVRLRLQPLTEPLQEVLVG